jgi:hypothetical protein
MALSPAQLRSLLDCGRFWGLAVAPGASEFCTKYAPGLCVKADYCKMGGNQMRLRIYAWMSCLACLFISTVAASAQTNAVSYTGRVLDAVSEEPVHGAKITLEVTGPPPVAYTDSNGVYSFQVPSDSKGVQAHVYVSCVGFRTFDQLITIFPDNRLQDIRLSRVPAKPAPAQAKAVRTGAVVIRGITVMDTDQYPRVRFFLESQDSRQIRIQRVSFHIEHIWTIMGASSLASSAEQWTSDISLPTEGAPYTISHATATNLMPGASELLTFTLGNDGTNKVACPYSLTCEQPLLYLFYATVSVVYDHNDNDPQATISPALAIPSPPPNGESTASEMLRVRTRSLAHEPTVVAALQNLAGVSYTGSELINALAFLTSDQRIRVAKDKLASSDPSAVLDGAEKAVLLGDEAEPLIPQLMPLLGTPSTDKLFQSAYLAVLQLDETAMSALIEASAQSGPLRYQCLRLLARLRRKHLHQRMHPAGERRMLAII